MRLDDFFIDSTDTSPWGLPSAKPSLDTDLLHRLLRAPDPNRSDVEVAVALARLLHDELERFGTSGAEVLDDVQMRDALRTLRVMLDRIGVSGFDPPFRDFAGFRNYWKREGMAGSGGYQLRRNCLADIFGDLHDQLEQLEVNSLTSTIADPVSTHPLLGWPAVDMELNELRRHFAAARTPQDYRGVGNDCVHVTEALSRHVYDPAVHLRPGETEPAVSQTKNRLDRYVEDTLLGPDSAALRKLAKATIELSQKVKHSNAPTRAEAGIAADAVILLAICSVESANPAEHAETETSPAPVDASMRTAPIRALAPSARRLHEDWICGAPTRISSHPWSAGPLNCGCIVGDLDARRGLPDDYC